MLRIRTFFIAAVGLLLLWTGIERVSAQSNWVKLTYQIDQRDVPPVPFNELTINLDVGEIEDAVVKVDGVAVDYSYSQEGGRLSVTTDGTRVDVWVQTTAAPDSIGDVQLAHLKDNKKWAWSHGMDDNVYLHEVMDIWDKHGYQASLYLIAEYVRDDRDEDWIVDVPEIHRRMANGWSIGAHGWEPSCDDHEYDKVKASFDRIQEVAEASSRPDYKIIGMAAPCFISEYHPVLLDLRDSGETYAQFNLSGSWYFQNVAAGGEEIQEDGEWVIPFEFDSPVGQEAWFDWDQPELAADEIFSRFDWMSTHATEDAVFWYNTSTHDRGARTFDILFPRLKSTYGELGTDEAWIVPPDHVYSYLLVREHSEVTLISAELSDPADDDQEDSNPIPTPDPADSFFELFLAFVRSIME